MKTNKKPLGYSHKKNLADGDLVSWKVWKVIDKKLQTIVNYGTILNVFVEPIL